MFHRWGLTVDRCNSASLALLDTSSRLGRRRQPETRKVRLELMGRVLVGSGRGRFAAGGN